MVWLQFDVVLDRLITEQQDFKFERGYLEIPVSEVQHNIIFAVSLQTTPCTFRIFDLNRKICIFDKKISKFSNRKFFHKDQHLTILHNLDETKLKSK